jgi:hypothetical protein
MNANLTDKSKVIIAALVPVVLAACAFFLRPSAPTGDLGHGGSLTNAWYNAIGTQSSPSTLSTSYNGASSSQILATGVPHLAIAGTYTPKAYGSGLFLRLERSLDNGNTWMPYNVISPGATGVLVYTSGSSTTSGAPFIVPGEGQGVATSGTALGFSFDLPIVADRIRIAAKEQTTSTAGTLNLQVMLQTN